MQTSYSYSGAAWHYDDDSLTRSSQRTWDQWRGFRTVTTETGTAPDPVAQTSDTYFQGMNGGLPVRRRHRLGLADQQPR